MITKQRTIPLIILKLDSLLRRLPPTHPKRILIQGDFAKRMAGYKGEQALDYYLNQLSPSDFLILHDLRLPSEPYFFQIDTLLLTTRYLLILEIKNIAGTLYFEKSSSQLIPGCNVQTVSSFRLKELTAPGTAQFAGKTLKRLTKTL
ncbi:nuclease-related domain-containing protein [Peribacillus kribbensis]|uniref:nuclease-related domain-containing protein n=1 Tax=Peribacillus kribbensis TaxID=356658 RepID=UPI001C55E286|nr:nuclease-related domain-containing protein [Peribacillus kribbensis]